MPEKFCKFENELIVNKEPKTLHDLALITTEKKKDEKGEDVFIEELKTIDEIVGKNFAIKLIKKDYEASFDALAEEITCSILDLRNPLTLFHEIGHGLIDSFIPDRLIDKIWDRIQACGKSGDNSIIFAESDLKELDEIVFIRCERLANAYAIYKIRQLKRKGIDVGPYDDPKYLKHENECYLNSHFRGMETIRNTKEYREKLIDLIKRYKLGRYKND